MRDPAADRCGELLALRREQDAFGNTAFWTLLAGGVAGAGTATFWFLTRSGDDASPRRARRSPPSSPPAPAASSSPAPSDSRAASPCAPAR
ncbi:MAG: hypothetical protein R3B70_07725 [Polyangiaceae bacterium]